MCKGFPSPLKTIPENKNITVMINDEIVTLLYVDLRGFNDINHCIGSNKVWTQIPLLRPTSGIKWEPDLLLITIILWIF